MPSLRQPDESLKNGFLRRIVERGHWDGVAPDEWVAYEYAKVRRLCDTLGFGDRTDIEFFDGLHEINGKGSFEFLHKHLKWPKP